MFNKWLKYWDVESDPAKKDYYDAWVLNQKAYDDFLKTKEYLNFFGPRFSPQNDERSFKAFYKHWCHSAKYPNLTNFKDFEPNKEYFWKNYCPEEKVKLQMI